MAGEQATMRAKAGPRWLRGGLVQARVLSTLMLRDALARFGHENLGFFWLIGEPLLLTCGIMLVWSILKVSHGAEIGIIPFALTGYSFITVWRHIVSRSMRLMQASASLSYHRQIHFMDNFIALALIETLSIFTSFLVAYVPLWTLGFCPPINDPLLLVGGFAFAGWFSISFGLVLAGISELSELVHHLIPALMYLTLPLTGTFFMVDWVPPKVREVVLWSPLVNCIEMIRGGLFPSEFPTYWSATFLITCCSVLTAIGLPLCRYANRHVET